MIALILFSIFFLVVVIFAVKNKVTLNYYFFEKEKLEHSKEEKIIIRQFNILFWIGFLGFVILSIFSQMMKKQKNPENFGGFYKNLKYMDNPKIGNATR